MGLLIRSARPERRTDEIRRPEPEHLQVGPRLRPRSASTSGWCRIILVLTFDTKIVIPACLAPGMIALLLLWRRIPHDYTNGILTIVPTDLDRPGTGPCPPPPPPQFLAVANVGLNCPELRRCTPKRGTGAAGAAPADMSDLQGISGAPVSKSPKPMHPRSPPGAVPQAVDRSLERSGRRPGAGRSPALRPTLCTVLHQIHYLFTRRGLIAEGGLHGYSHARKGSVPVSRST